MGAPQIIFVGLLGFNLCAGAYLHGKPKDGKNSFWITLVGTAINVGLLWWGGFFG